MIFGVVNIRQQGAELVREADRFNVPVIQDLMTNLSSWKYKNIQSYLNKNFIKSLSEDEFQKELDNLSALGEVKKLKHIRHVRHGRYDHWLFSSCAVNKYSVSTDFENDSAVVVINLNQCYEKVSVTNFQIHSKLISRKNPPKSAY